ncbi:MAG: hypothetical protein HY431_00670 [Candidatus Levybacteria bacterium]|nr:hypothetical protein [Candidatus Levybacteria bacterium]
MNKRKPLEFDTGKLEENLKESIGKGVGALLPSAEQSQKPIKPIAEAVEVKIKPAERRKQSIKQASNIVSNIAILQLTDEDIEQLRETAYQAQTYRLSKREIDWIKDIAYRLSKEVKRGKVAQIDILRIALKLFENLLATNKADLIAILEKIK